MFDCMWLKTPDSTFSPLWNSPAGPKPLQSVEHMGLPDGQLQPGAEAAEGGESPRWFPRPRSSWSGEMELGSSDHGEGKMEYAKCLGTSGTGQTGDGRGNFDQLTTIKIKLAMEKGKIAASEFH